MNKKIQSKPSSGGNTRNKLGSFITLVWYLTECISTPIPYSTFMRSPLLSECVVHCFFFAKTHSSHIFYLFLVFFSPLSLSILFPYCTCKVHCVHSLSSRCVSEFQSKPTATTTTTHLKTVIFLWNGHFCSSHLYQMVMLLLIRPLFVSEM